MSAGAAVVSRDLSLLAPKFADAVRAALDDCASDGLDAFVYEAMRSDELQRLYYSRGRPPSREYPRPVTNARSALYGWHRYGLAVDVISREREWDVPPSWFADVADHFKRHGCKWGGDWKQRDLPHMQWGPCKPSPSDEARRILAADGLHAVWAAVGAL